MAELTSRRPYLIRALYDWVLDNTETPSRPQQTEFARLNISYTMMSKFLKMMRTELLRFQGFLHLMSLGSTMLMTVKRRIVGAEITILWPLWRR